MENRISTIRHAFYKSIPVMAGYIVLGTGFGILMNNAGYGVLWTAAMSAFIYAGSMQYVGVGLLTGSILGSLLGAVLPFPTTGIEFSMTALFIASFTEQWLTTKDHIPALTGLLSTLLCLVIFGRQNFLIPAMLCITLVLTILRRREEKPV